MKLIKRATLIVAIIAALAAIVGVIYTQIDFKNNQIERKQQHFKDLVQDFSNRTSYDAIIGKYLKNIKDEPDLSVNEAAIRMRKEALVIEYESLLTEVKYLDISRKQKKLNKIKAQIEIYKSENLKRVDDNAFIVFDDNRNFLLERSNY